MINLSLGDREAKKFLGWLDRMEALPPGRLPPYARGIREKLENRLFYLKRPPKIKKENKKAKLRKILQSTLLLTDDRV